MTTLEDVDKTPGIEALVLTHEQIRAGHAALVAFVPEGEEEPDLVFLLRTDLEEAMKDARVPIE